MEIIFLLNTLAILSSTHYTILFIFMRKFMFVELFVVKFNLSTSRLSVTYSNEMAGSGAECSADRLHGDKN